MRRDKLANKQKELRVFPCAVKRHRSSWFLHAPGYKLVFIFILLWLCCSAMCTHLTYNIKCNPPANSNPVPLLFLSPRGSSEGLCSIYILFYPFIAQSRRVHQLDNVNKIATRRRIRMERLLIFYLALSDVHLKSDELM